MDSKLILKFLDLMGLIVFTANRHQVAAAALWLRSARSGVYCTGTI